MAAQAAAELSKIAADGGEQKRAREDETRGGGNRAGQSVPPQRVVAHQRHHERVRQRQPHRADLIDARRARIEHAAGDVEVRLRVAVIQSVQPFRHVRATNAALRTVSAANAARTRGIKTP